MRAYLSTIHTRSDQHKKRFSLAVSGGITLIIFGIWAFVHFGVEPAKVADAGSAQTGLVPAGQDLQTANAVTPFEALGGSIGDAWKSLKSEASSVGNSLRNGN